MEWIYLLIAGLFEAGWASSLKMSNGLSRLTPTLATLVLMGLSVWFLGLAMRTIPAGTAYAVWVGIGAAAMIVIGLTFFGEPASLLRLASLFLIVVGVVGLYVAEAG